MTNAAFCKQELRRFKRISLPNGMLAAWHGGGDQQVSRVKTLGLGGAFLSASLVRTVGTPLRVVFTVPEGIVQAEGVVRNTAPGEGMGVEFTRMDSLDRDLLERLMTRLLR